jgi:hypothetical protein
MVLNWVVCWDATRADPRDSNSVLQLVDLTAAPRAEKTAWTVVGTTAGLWVAVMADLKVDTKGDQAADCSAGLKVVMMVVSSAARWAVCWVVMRAVDWVWKSARHPTLRI